ncbi:MAG: AAA family ATPase [Desulfovibrionaceae bacterium]|nr:AAA family ATPase [Desulfovibrionaceae bacterium]
MLELLRIQNLALIEDMELEFSSGLNVLSGETGAGKSFILKAINFLLGERMDAGLVRPGADKAVAEALFTLPPNKENPEERELIIRRELAGETGRSRLYLNNALASQEIVRDLRGKLIIHASQHGQQKLLQPAFQAQILDSFLDRPDLLEAREEKLKTLREIALKRAEMEKKVAELEERRDVLEFQQKQIDIVAPLPGEDDELEERRQGLKQQEELREYLDRVQEVLLDSEGLLNSLGELDSSLAALAQILPEYRDDSDEVAAARSYLSELAVRIRRQGMEHVDEDDIEAIDARLFKLSQLKRSLRRSLPEILDLKQEIEDNLSFLDACGLDLTALDREERSMAESLGQTLNELNSLRRKKAEELAEELMTSLRHLGFSEQVGVEFAFSEAQLHPGGEGFPPCIEDRARMLWRPNPGQPMQPLDKIASGGELSRFLLAVVGLMARDESPTLIFDEVDSGVGGLTLNHVSDRLKKLAGTHQLLLITHWPQLAARADRHFHVVKEVVDGQTYTRCSRIAGNNRIEELARMAGGGPEGLSLAMQLAEQR